MNTFGTRIETFESASLIVFVIIFHKEFFIPMQKYGCNTMIESTVVLKDNRIYMNSYGIV